MLKPNSFFIVTYQVEGIGSGLRRMVEVKAVERAGEGDGEENWTVLKTGFVLEGENNSTSSGSMVLKTCVWATTPFLE